MINAHVVTLDKSTKVSRQSWEAAAPQSQILVQGSPSSSRVGCSCPFPSSSPQAGITPHPSQPHHWHKIRNFWHLEKEHGTDCGADEENWHFNYYCYFKVKLWLLGASQFHAAHIIFPTYIWIIYPSPAIKKLSYTPLPQVAVSINIALSWWVQRGTSLFIEFLHNLQYLWFRKGATGGMACEELLCLQTWFAT